ncbi:MAG: Gfo/Idh/MocA family oxidoreductase [Planctomycetia bacterium]|nr:Gfo/Idh/MocA family oxidoreductase [Planctomycetia bacterium]
MSLNPLTPEEKAIGKDNFYAALGSPLTRREFIGGSLAAGAISGVGLGSYYFGYGTSVDNPVRIGIIGTGDEGNVLIGAINPAYVQVVAIADIRPFNIHRAFHGDQSSPAIQKIRTGLMTKYDWKTEDEAHKHVTRYEGNYEELLNDPAVEGVVIALPLHLHHEAAIKAMKAGKHVLTEKLMGHSVGKCKSMGRVAHQEKKLLATGHQRHYSVLYDNAVSTIRAGLIGKVHHIRAQWHRQKDTWSPPLPAKIHEERLEFVSKLAEAEEALFKAKGSDKEIAKLVKRVEDVRKKLDASSKQWLLIEKDLAVKAKDYGYLDKSNGGSPFCQSPEEELFRWRLWDRTGGGLMAELGSHQLDASGIFISASHPLDKEGHSQKIRPLVVSAVGGRHLYGRNRDCEDHVYCTYEYPAADYDPSPGTEMNEKRIAVTYSSINGNGYGGYGEVVMGETGTLILENEQEVMLLQAANAVTNLEVKKDDKAGPLLNTTSSAPPEAAVAKKALDGPVSKGYTEEIEHWAWCIRNFKADDYANTPQPKCKPEVAIADAIIALTTNIAIKERRQIEFKPEWYDINHDDTPDGVAPEVKV